MLKRILLIEHAPLRADGFLQAHLELAPDSELVVWRCYQESSPPEGDFQSLILSGGPMMVESLVNGEHPFFETEKAIIMDCADRDIPILGVCLGSQILCHLFGGTVGPEQWVVGWHEVLPTHQGMGDPLFVDVDGGFATFQYHRDHFLVLPRQSEILATSQNSQYEAFRIRRGAGKIWGCIFHPEMDVHLLMKIYNERPELFTVHEVSQQALAPLDDSRANRRRILRNFFLERSI